MTGGKKEIYRDVRFFHGALQLFGQRKDRGSNPDSAICLCYIGIIYLADMARYRLFVRKVPLNTNQPHSLPPSTSNVIHHLSVKKNETTNSTYSYLLNCGSSRVILLLSVQASLSHRPLQTTQSTNVAGSVAEWLRCSTWNQQVAGSNPARASFFTHVPLSPSSIIWYQPTGGDALWLGR